MRKSSLSNICKSPVRKLIAEDNQRLRNALNQKREKVTTDWSMWYLADCRAFVCQLAGVGNRFRTADRFQLGMILRTGPKKECLAQANLFTTCKTTWHWFNERPRLVLRNKMLRPALMMAVNGIPSVFLMSVVFFWSHAMRRITLTTIGGRPKPE